MVLNQNYEPMQICTAKRALNLVFLGKAKLVETEGQDVISISARYPFPSVVRIDRYIRIPNRNVVLSRKNILKRDGHQCQYCGATGISLTIDHIVPKKQFGKDTWENLVTACITCNNKKGSRTPENANMKLFKKPKKPTRIHYLQKFIRRNNQSWKQYLYLD